ncbi:MAG: hypothetical protein WD492_07160 [Alkalispirochaeta sp.]
MEGLLRAFLAVLIGSVVAMGIPREIGREHRWVVAWEHTLDSEVADTATETLAESSKLYFPVETARRFFLVNSYTGDVIVTGFKTDVFLASSRAMVNQSADAPRWAVQSWDGRMLRVVRRRGIPQLHGATLLQFDSESTVYGDLVTNGEQWHLDLPRNPTVYHLADDGAGTQWFAVGTVGGTVVVTDGPGGKEWVYTREFEPDTATTPAIYGIHVAATERSADPVLRLPSVYIVHSLAPQAVTRLDLEDTGEVAEVGIGEIPDEYAGPGPRSIVQLGQDLLVVGLDGALFVARLRTEDHTTIPVTGLSSLYGLGRADNDLVVATGTGKTGSVIIVGAPDMSKIAHWELSDGSSKAWVYDRTLSESIVVVQHNRRLVGLEMSS